MMYRIFTEIKDMDAPATACGVRCAACGRAGGGELGSTVSGPPPRPRAQGSHPHGQGGGCEAGRGNHCYLTFHCEMLQSHYAPLPLTIGWRTDAREGAND